MSFCQAGRISSDDYYYYYYSSYFLLAPNCFNEYSACQNSSLASNVTIIGAYSSTLFHENGKIINHFFVN